MDLPQEYIDGRVYFCGQYFSVDARALIPRLETEELVKKALKIVDEKEVTTLIDIGTGTGIIPLSLAKKSPRLVSIFALDISPDALELATANAEALSLSERVIFQQSDLLSSMMSVPLDGPLLITANLPYILPDEVYGELHHEPRIALVGGAKTGFELYERLFLQLAHWMHRPPSTDLVIEFGIWQRDTAETLCLSYGWEVDFFADLRGIERFAHIRIR